MADPLDILQPKHTSTHERPEELRALFQRVRTPTKDPLTMSLTEPLIQPIDTPDVPKQTRFHIDEWLDTKIMIDRNEPPIMGYVHLFFTLKRMPAVTRMMYDPYTKGMELYVTYEDERWRVTGASRMGDIWLSKRFNVDHGYDRRIDFDLSKLTDWSVAP